MGIIVMVKLYLNSFMIDEDDYKNVVGQLY